MKRVKKGRHGLRDRVVARWAIVLVAFCVSDAATAATIHVTHFDDVINDNDGTCTLREAVRSSNVDVSIDACVLRGSGQSDLILLSVGTYHVDLASGNAEDASADGDLDVNGIVEIRGLSPDYTIIDGDAETSQERVFDFIKGGGADDRILLRNLTVTGGHEANANGGNIRISNLSFARFENVVVSNGRAVDGGGVFASGLLNLIDSRIENNSTVEDDGQGGGIFVVGISTILRTIIAENSAGIGGGAHTSGVVVRIDDSEIRDNQALGFNDQCSGGGLAVSGTLSDFRMRRTLVANNSGISGGGICWAGAPLGRITHSAIVGNNATEEGGGIWGGVDGFIRHSTISGNVAVSGGGLYTASPSQMLLDAVTLAANAGGGGLFNESGAILEFSILADNTGGNCLGSVPTSGPYNLDDGNTCAFPTNDPIRPSLTNTDALLGPLQDNGGGLPTLALLPGSPAIDAYDSEERPNCQQTPDQRTYPRGYPPVDADGSPDDHLCDIGAYEFGSSFLVDSFEDAIDTNLADGICADTNGGCTLRAAVMQANATPFFNEIELGAGTFALSLTGADEDEALTGDLDIADDVLIRGLGSAVTVIDGGGLDRVFGEPANIKMNEQPEANLVEFRDLSITGGSAPDGGAILASLKPLAMERVTLRGNTATSGDGGAIRCVGQCRLKIVDSTIDGNMAPSNGGGIYFGGSGEFEMDRVTLSNNEGGIGGALESAGVLHAINSTFSGNTAGSSGAFIASRAILENTTITNNEASTDSGALFLLEASAIVNTIIAANRVGADIDNCSFNANAVTSLGYNISDSDAADCNLITPNDLIDTDPLLGPLADNGGMTHTHALLPNSPAIDGGDNESCRIFDQRAFMRPADGSGDGNAICDIGAFEAQSADLSINSSATPNPVTVGNNFSVTVTVVNAGPGVAIDAVVTATAPSTLNVVSATTSGANCVVAANEVTCELGDIAANSITTAEIVANTNQLGAAMLSFQLTSSSGDTSASNNSVDVTVNVIAASTGGSSAGGGGGGVIGPLGIGIAFCCYLWRQMRRSRRRRLVCLAIASLATPMTLADPVESLIPFSAGTPAVASEVNDNFSAVANATNDNDACIALLEARYFRPNCQKGALLWDSTLTLWVDQTSWACKSCLQYGLPLLHSIKNFHPFHKHRELKSAVGT